MSRLVQIYEKGEGVDLDLEEAEMWRRKVAETAPVSLSASGDMQSHEVVAEATSWYRKAAERGDVFAMLKLGRIHERGEGVQKRLSEAVKWYQKAADAGSAEGKNRVRLLK